MIIDVGKYVLTVIHDNDDLILYNKTEMWIVHIQGNWTMSYSIPFSIPEPITTP